MELSLGDFEGKGQQRKKELWASCGKLGVEASNVTLWKCAELVDGPKSVWNVDLTSKIVLRHVVSHNIDTVRFYLNLG